MKKWAFDPKNTKNHVFGVKHPYFHLKGPVLTSGMMTNQNTLKMHFSPESLQNRFTFGHILSREVDRTCISKCCKSSKSSALT